MDNIKENYESFWKEIVENPDGSINKEQLMKELADYSTLIDHISHIYCELSGNCASNPMIYPEVILQLNEENLSESYDRGYQDALDDNK